MLAVLWGATCSSLISIARSWMRAPALLDETAGVAGAVLGFAVGPAAVTPAGLALPLLGEAPGVAETVLGIAAAAVTPAGVEPPVLVAKELPAEEHTCAYVPCRQDMV